VWSAVGNPSISNFYTSIKNRYGRVAGDTAKTEIESAALV
jgi:hypothetical protein